VNPNTGSDTSGNGSTAAPYKTLTKALEVLASAKIVASNVSIALSSGDYDVANGEKFPLVVPKNVTLAGSNYGTGARTGSFIDGVGEDKIFEAIVHAARRTAYTTLEIPPGISVTVNNVYVGASKISLPSSRAVYASFDDLGTSSSTTAAFGAGIASTLRNVNGVLVAGGSFSCGSCNIKGNDFGIAALTVPTVTSSPAASSPTSTPTSPSSPSSTAPTITLTHPTSDSVIGARLVDILTDGSVNVTASNSTFAKTGHAYEDSLSPIVPVLVRGAVDFGGGSGGSVGGNSFIGARVTEIAVTRRTVTVSAQDDIWNPSQQRANRNGQYTRTIVFRPGASGKNVTIMSTAGGSTVTVGPAPVPTPSPSATPSTSPSPSPT
ncbi:MAG: DUF1565 domain-containing protein, partial [Candidatus Eremiobacteraeota bacterium]|nr:DUF1565 domain-containing protein [Candidatus Eremiobacteraeota bacterium]